ncbi:MAG: formate/nitrite transporter family protein [Lachnospiraceae bacterium]|nr:formate/nitrite transporter family protein [Lachnospiraceae bacterium]
MGPIISAGEVKSKYSITPLMIKSFMSGMLIAFGGLGSQVINTASGTSFLGAFVFPVGLILVICTGSELFTGDCLMAMAVADKKITLGSMIKTLILVYIGNFIGSLFVVFMAYAGNLPGMYDGKLGEAMVKTAATKTALSPGVSFAKGVLCNILVCAAVLVAIRTKEVTGKMLAAYFPVMLFVLCGFEHSIANMYFIPMGQLISSFDIGLLMNNLIPVTLGNVAGGVVFALGMYYCSRPAKS